MPRAQAHGHTRDIIVVGGSAGGVEATITLARGLPAELPAAVFVVIHTGAQRSQIAEILSRTGALPAHFAVHGERVRRGRIYVAPPDNHMTLEAGAVRVVRGPRENGTRPAVDPLFRSAAHAYGPRVIGVVLSGTLDCGSAGLRLIKQAGGVAVVQHREEALFPDMPLNAARVASVDHEVPSQQMASLLAELAGRPVSRGTGNGAALGRRRRVRSLHTDLTCPECHGTLVEERPGKTPSFVCHVGHAFSLDSLADEQSRDLESALWSSVRLLREREALSRRIATTSSLKPRLDEKVRALSEHAEMIERFIMDRRALRAPALAAWPPKRPVIGSSPRKRKARVPRGRTKT